MICAADLSASCLLQCRIYIVYLRANKNCGEVENVRSHTHVHEFLPLSLFDARRGVNPSTAQVREARLPATGRLPLSHLPSSVKQLLGIRSTYGLFQKPGRGGTWLPSLYSYAWGYGFTTVTTVRLYMISRTPSPPPPEYFTPNRQALLTLDPEQTLQVELKLRLSSGFTPRHACSARFRGANGYVQLPLDGACSHCENKTTIKHHHTGSSPTKFLQKISHFLPSIL